MYRLYRNYMDLFLYKNDQLFFTGKLDMGYSAYGFRFQDEHDFYQMKATGMFFWRNITLYKNGDFIERYKRNTALTSKVKLTEFRNILLVNNMHLAVMQRKHEKTSKGTYFLEWRLPNENFLIQSFCLAVLRIIDGLQDPGI